MQLLIPKAEFQNLSELEVLAALESTDMNPIADEVARLMDGYTANFEEHCRKIGGIPSKTLRPRPNCAIEKVALDLFLSALKQEIGS